MNEEKKTRKFPFHLQIYHQFIVSFQFNKNNYDMVTIRNNIQRNVIEKLPVIFLYL